MTYGSGKAASMRAWTYRVLFAANLAFGDWALALPQIDTVTANQRNVTGWIVSVANPRDICTSFNAPPTVAQSGLDRPPPAED